MLRRLTDRALIAAAMTGLLMLMCAESASGLQYKPKLGETLSHIALIHYGNADKYIYISMTNQISDPSTLSHERVLWIPTVWRYRLRRGDELVKIAKRFLKRSDRAEFLMWFNNISDPRTLRVGMLIKIPFLIRHRAKEGQNMVDLARRYYFQSKLIPMLRRFNHKRTNSLRLGEIVYVPIIDPEAATEKVQKRLARYKEREAKEAQLARERAMRIATAKANQWEKDSHETEQPDTNDPLESQETQATPDASMTTDSPDASDSQVELESLDAGLASVTPDASDGSESTQQPEALDTPTSATAKSEPISSEQTDPASLVPKPLDREVLQTLKPPSAKPKPRATSNGDAALLTEATQWYQQGDYELARGGLVRFLQRPISKKDECKARELLAYCLIALDRQKEAEHEFVRLLMIKPRFKLDAVTTSPKIIEVFQRAIGKN